MQLEPTPVPTQQEPVITTPIVTPVVTPAVTPVVTTIEIADSPKPNALKRSAPFPREGKREPKRIHLEADTVNIDLEAELKKKIELEKENELKKKLAEENEMKKKLVIEKENKMKKKIAEENEKKKIAIEKENELKRKLSEIENQEPIVIEDVDLSLASRARPYVPSKIVKRRHIETTTPTITPMNIETPPQAPVITPPVVTPSTSTVTNPVPPTPAVTPLSPEAQEQELKVKN